MEWSFVWISVVVCASILSAMNSFRLLTTYKSGQGIDLSVMDILVVMAGLPRTLLAGAIMLCATGVERLSEVKVFSIDRRREIRPEKWVNLPDGTLSRVP